MVAQKAAKKTRGEGAMAIMYGDKAGKSDLKRPNTDVVSVILQQRVGGQSKTYDVTQLPAGVKDALAAIAFAKLSQTQVNNSVNDKGDNVISLADAKWADLVAGKIYNRAAGGEKLGRKVDATKYGDAMKLAMNAMNKAGRKSGKTGKVVQPMDDKQHKDFVARIESMSGKDRTDFIRGLKKDSYFKAAWAQLDYQSKAKALKADDTFDF